MTKTQIACQAAIWMLLAIVGIPFTIALAVGVGAPIVGFWWLAAKAVARLFS